MLTVAIATEYDDYDAEIYRALLERLLGLPVQRWQTPMRFNGDKSVRKRAPLYLSAAKEQGVRHALFAIDNDGGQKRRPEHDASHVPATEAADERAGCRVCWISEALPQSWIDEERKRCIVVPVQTIETWLLCLRGDPFTAPSPEQEYHRPVLKKRFFGTPLPPVEDRIALALAQVQKSNALDILRQRKSFRDFEAQLTDWSSLPRGL